MGQTEQVDIVEYDKYAVIKLNGKCEADLANELQIKMDKYRDETKTNIKNFIIDFSDVIHVSSTALSVLLILKRFIEKNNGKLAFANLPDYVLKIVKIIDTGNDFRIYNYINDALEWLKTDKSSEND